MDASQIPNFQQCCEQQFQLRERLGTMEDARAALQISAGVVAEAICFMGALGSHLTLFEPMRPTRPVTTCCFSPSVVLDMPSASLRTFPW